MDQNPMNRLQSPKPLRGFGRPTAIAAASLCLAATSANAAEKTYQYYRFLPVKAYGNNGNIQLGEFTFSRGGTVLNTNNRNGSGTGVINVAITSGTQNPTDGEGPAKVGDGDLNTKWFKGNPFSEAEALVFNFGAPVTIDSYNWGSGNDSVAYWRNPVSWRFYGSTDGTNWEVLDSRSDYPINNADLTYQAGFTLPASIQPALLSFAPAASTPGIVLNDTPATLAWDTDYSDAVTIDPGAIPGPADGTTLVTPDDNSTFTYTLTASRAGTTDVATGSTNIRTVAGGSATYRYVRFKVTKTRGSGWIQMSEFSFLNGTTPVPVSFVENPGGDSNGGEGVNNLIDGSGTNNKWLDFNNAPVIFDFGEPSEETPTPSFNKYSFFTGNDAPDRDPLQWTLEGSNDKTTWSLIENVDFDYPTPLPRNVTSGAIPLPGPSIKPLVYYFTGSSATLIQGQPFTLSWSTGGMAEVAIDQGVGAVAGSGSVPLNPPLGETTYTLTGSSPGDLYELTRTFTVNVVPVPETTTIAYDDFSGVGDEMSLLGSATTFGNVLRLTPDLQGQLGEAWFRLRQPVAEGFEATFGISMNQDEPNGYAPADGLAFVIQNAPAGSDSGSVGEGGVPEKALNIKFKSFGFDSENASQLQVLAGTTVLATKAIDLTPGTVLYGIPAGVNGGPFPYTLGTPAGKPPYRIRVVYAPGTPGKLDIYFDGVAIIQNLEVDLAEIGAVDANGDAIVGFSGRTGGNVQNNDITDWHMRYGDFSALPPFGMVKANYRLANGNPVFDIVWNAEDGVFYQIESSPDMSPGSWVIYGDYGPIDGQLGARIPITDAKKFFRVVESP